jgi:hypothetical protein
MTGWEVDPGKWEITQGTEATENGSGTVTTNETGTLNGVKTSTEPFERSTDLGITFAPHTTTVIEMKLVEKGVPYWSRYDLGIDKDDVKVSGSTMAVTVHSLGAIDAPAAKLVLRDRSGKVLATADTPVLKAPTDLLPKTAQVQLTMPAGTDWTGGTVTIESTGSTPEITQRNNTVQL